MRLRGLLTLGLVCFAGYASAFTFRSGDDGVVRLADVSCPLAGDVRLAVDALPAGPDRVEVLVSVHNGGPDPTPVPHVISSRLLAPGVDQRARIVHALLTNVHAFGEGTIPPGDILLVETYVLPLGEDSLWDTGERIVHVIVEPGGLCAAARYP